MMAIHFPFERLQSPTLPFLLSPQPSVGRRELIFSSPIANLPSTMAVLAVALLILTMAVHSSGSWCVCKDGVSQTSLQKTLDYACGAGADCGPILQKGPCFQPDNVKAHCSYAANSYFQKKGQAQGSCNFSATAFVSSSDPSTTGCVYPSNPSSSTTTTVPVTTNTSVSPYRGTPTGVYGGIGSGAGPAGAGFNPDESDGGLRLQKNSFLFFLIALLVAQHFGGFKEI